MEQVPQWAPCPRCSTPRSDSVFCKSCNLLLEGASGTAERATLTRRFFGDSLLEGVLALVTLYIGWLIWLYFTAKTSQTPAKRILNVYIIDTEGYRPATAGRVWLREVVVKILAVGIISNLSAGIFGLINYAWAIWDKDRRAVHDHMARTVVVYAPSGLASQA